MNRMLSEITPEPEDNPFGDEPAPTIEEKAPHKIRVEMVYRVWTETEITEETYSNALADALDRDANATIEQAAFEETLGLDEEDMYTQVFEEEIAANGPDDVYILVQLVDPDGHVIKQGFVEGNDEPLSVKPQYHVAGVPDEVRS